MIQAITFDFWDTLFVAVGARDLRRQRIKEALARAGGTSVSDADVERASQRAWQEWDRVWEQERRTFGALRWTSLVLASLGVNLPGPELETLAHAMAASGVEVQPPLVDGVAQVLPRLAARYRLGVVCDTGLSPGRMLRQRMQACGILGHFTQLTFSDELGVSKPHPDAFLTTLARLDAPPEAAVHIGDNPRTDVAGAQGAGMQAIRFTGVRDWPEDGGRADAEIASFDDLEPLLTRWD